MKKMTFSFGRLNPPTIGHGKLLDALKKAAKGEYRMYLSNSHDRKRNPLSVSDKVKYTRLMFPKHSLYIMNDSKIVNVFDILVNLHAEGYEEVVMVVGSDRVGDFRKLMEQYNGVEGKRHGFYDFKRITVKSAGERDPDATGVEGMSASKMRKAVSENDFDSFQMGLPSGFRKGQELFKILKKEMGVLNTFKEHLQEVTAQKASKDFETFIANLAVLSNKGETNLKKLETIISTNKGFEGLRSKDKSEVISAVSKLNGTLRKNWTKGINANFETGLHKGIYGKKSEAKADIILYAGSKKYGISIKKKGDVVVASSQDPTEFENIFWSGFKKLKEDKKIDINESPEWSTVLGEAEDAVISIRDNIVGQLKSRLLKPDWFNKLKVGKKRESTSEQEMREKFFIDLESTIKTQNEIVTEDYKNMLNKVAKDGQKLIEEKIGNNPLLKEYVIWEALSATLKYEGQLPAATYILSPSGCYDISTPDKPYVKACAKASEINFRGMVQGLRSGKEPTMNPVLKNFYAGKHIDMIKLYDNVRTMKMSMKIDLKGAKRKSMEKELEEGVFSDMWSKMVEWWNLFKSNIQDAITKMQSITDDVSDKLSRMKKVSIIDIMLFNKVKITGTIKTP